MLDVKALNKDGGIVVGDMDFKGSDIEVTMNALIGSMLRKGYLNELANSILISVDNNDPAKGEMLQEKLTEKVNELLESDGFFGAGTDHHGERRFAAACGPVRHHAGEGAAYPANTGGHHGTYF